MALGVTRQNPPVDEATIIRVERTHCQHMVNRRQVGECPGLLFIYNDPKWGERGLVWAFATNAELETELTRLGPIFGDKKLKKAKNGAPV